MSLEAIAALLGHRSMRMTLTYARISDRTVADEYFRVTQAVEASYANAEPIAADATGPNMRRLAADHRRLLGNGHCTRPIALDCQFETICERCGFFDTGPAVRHDPAPPTRPRRRHDQPDRADLYQILDGSTTPHDTHPDETAGPATDPADHRNIPLDLTGSPE